MDALSIQSGKEKRLRPGKSPGKPFADLWARPGYLIRRLHQIHMGLFLGESKEFDITPVQYSILTVLYSGECLDQITLSTEVGVDRKTGSDVVRRLERRNLLNRSTSEQDRRAKLVQITAAGRRTVEQMHKCMQEAQERLLSPLDAKEKRAFIGFLQKVVEKNNGASRAPISIKSFSVKS